MASGAPASYTGRVPRRGASMASQRSEGGPRRALWPSIGFATGGNETRTVTGSTKKYTRSGLTFVPHLA